MFLSTIRLNDCSLKRGEMMKKALYAIALLTVLVAAMLVFAAVSDSVFLQKMLKPVVVQSCKIDGC